mgnify:CR=1 FL=1
MNRKLHVVTVCAPVSLCVAVTVHLASAPDHSAFVTSCLKRMCLSIEYSFVVSRRYWRIDGPSAMDFASVHGLKLKPSVCMSLSERTPGYLKRSHVPPKSSRPSRISLSRSRDCALLHVCFAEVWCEVGNERLSHVLSVSSPSRLAVWNYIFNIIELILQIVLTCSCSTTSVNYEWGKEDIWDPLEKRITCKSCNNVLFGTLDEIVKLQVLIPEDLTWNLSNMGVE